MMKIKPDHREASLWANQDFFIKPKNATYRTREDFRDFMGARSRDVQDAGLVQGPGGRPAAERGVGRGAHGSAGLIFTHW